MKYFFSFILFIGFPFSQDSPYVVVLGIAQDGGSPHAGCEKRCCKELWTNGDKEKVSCIGIVDPRSGKSWMIDATPDFPEQYRILTKEHDSELAGIFLTHAHMGHYTGLLHLGREVMGAKDVPVFAMPEMKKFLESNGPWNQLVQLNNIEIQPMKNDKEIKLANGLIIEPFLVPHRDEYSETVGYKIMGLKQSVLFIPDIDKWEKWDQEIFEVIQHIDIALLDGTFYSQDELPNRDMGEIPHPFIVESMEALYNLNSSNRNKVHFIHFNHSNPAIRNGAASNLIRSNRFDVAREGMIFPL
ncbi:MAG TPA: pyrroloquinoline quinone biosynthesis protein PqqB [Candidatus Marinimicrobia bacterium]|nr:pyrroloquinoline quinone biosynthesis protein PqqB [Candidatus Neomarinimicrobiota bacterium]